MLREGQGLGARWQHYLGGSVDVEHEGVILGDHTPAPGAALAPLVPDELQEAAHEAPLGPRRGPFLKPGDRAHCVTVSRWELDHHYFWSYSHSARQSFVPKAQRGAIMGLWSHSWPVAELVKPGSA